MISTILGGTGYIGRHLASTLHELGEPCWIPERGEPEIFSRSLGIVYYCIGLTADFRIRPFETVDSHVCVLKKILEQADFEQLIYLSSTRLYSKSELALESEMQKVASFNKDNLYNISKLMGESLVLSSERNCQVVRLSNVIGHQIGEGNFIGMLIKEAKENRKIILQTSLNSEKDYIWIDDAVNALVAIAKKRKKGIYNIASGKNIRHKFIAGLFENIGIAVTVAKDSPTIIFPKISINKLISETGFIPGQIEEQLSELVNIEIAS